MTKPFKGKKVLIMGLGKFPQGSGSSAARFFARAGARVTVTDLKSKADLKEAVSRLAGFRISYVLGRHRNADFQRADIVVRNPDVRSHSPFLAIARKHGARIVTDISVFLSLCPPVLPIGVTGTRGKSTTTALLGAMLMNAGHRTYVGGNIQVSPLTFLSNVWRDYRNLKSNAVVLELSSWQLEGLSELGLAPRMAIITNVLRDHLNTYPSMKEYGYAKSEIFLKQGKSGVTILNYDNAITRSFAKKVPGRLFWFSRIGGFRGDGTFVRKGRIIFRFDGIDETVAKVSDIRYLPGDHNVENVLAAVTAAKHRSVPNTVIVRTLRTFVGLPNRLETIHTMRGITYVNDTTATTPDGAIAALKTLGAKKKVVLIAGGKDKELVFKEMAVAIKKYTKAIVLFDGTATLKLVWELKQIRYPIETIPIVKDMKLAIALARQIATKKDTIVLSPGAASFGLFKNEFDRGDQFVRAVKKM
jgi:UDP-N-acetylmuramoylalanine--D-glutamate ligase